MTTTTTERDEAAERRAFASLGDSQRRLLAELYRETLRTDGAFPTVALMADLCEWTKSTAYAHLKALVRAGFVWELPAVSGTKSAYVLPDLHVVDDRPDWLREALT